MPLTNPDYVVTKQRLADFYQGILPYLGAPEVIRPTVYGIHITNSESDPDAKVQYIADAVNMTPAHMDFTNGVFDYGSWENAFFMPKPCMLKYDGTVDYYLDPNDYTKKADGTASDVANTSYEGNAMMEWPKIWLKIVPVASDNNASADIYISDYNEDGSYTCWPFHNANGEMVDHFYTAIYNGSLISNKLRSLSGQQAVNSITAQQEYSYAQANNPSGLLIWTTETITDIDLINILIILISKSTNSQAKFGEGLITGGTESINNSFRTGVHNTKGLFYGTNSGTASTYTNAVKIFGMENWWGFALRRYLGEIVSNGSNLRKLTYGQEDGSTVTGYNFTGTGYLNTNAPKTSGTTGGYVSTVIFTKYGLCPNVASGTSTSHYCDAMLFNNNTVAMPVRSGSSTDSNACGIFYKKMDRDSSIYGWGWNSALSARPLT